MTPDGPLPDEFVVANEMAAGPCGAVLDAAAEQLGRPVVDAWLAEWKVPLPKLIETRAWVSLRFVELLFDRVVRAGGPELLDKMGRASISPKSLGPIYPLFRAFASPAWTFARIGSSMARFNKAQDVRIETLGPTRVRIHFTLRPGVTRPPTFHSCAFIAAQISSVPALFDFPPAQVEHVRCQGRGDAECEYVVQWREPARAASLWLAALGGAGAGAALAWTLDPSPQLVGLGAASLGLAAWALALAYRQRRALAGLIEDAHDHNAALTRSLRDNELRFAELLEAKASVERRVEERTAELSATGTKLAQALDEVRALDRAKTEFFANVSHDLRTPLTLIVAPLEDLLAGREPPGGREAALAAMHRNASRLLVLIHQLLDLAKVDAGGTRLARVPTDLGALADGVAAGFRAAAAGRGLEVRVETPAGLTPLLADSAWLESALANLVANALRFAKTRVTLAVRDVGDAVIFTVADDGVGIPAADLPRVFERFSQAGEGDARRGGTGLGLAIVREAARLHGGSVTVESADGVGTTFTVRLPRSAPDVAPELAARDDRASTPVAPTAMLLAALPGGADASTDATTAPPGAPLVVVAEDNDDLRAFVGAVLAPHYRVVATANGEEALAAVERERPDAVVTDLSMPRMNGLDLVRALRARPQTRHLPVVLLTAHRDTQHVLAAFDAGANDYVTKPFHGRELLARVGVHVAQERLTAEVARSERLATLGTSAASIAHGVRNPLTSLQSGLPALRAKIGATLDPKSLELLGVMEQCATRIGTIITDLLDLSRVDREPEARWAPSTGLLAAVRLVGVRVPPAVQFEVDVDEAPLLDCRPGDLTDVFLNLLDNAARAVGAHGRVRVRARVEDGSWVLRVEDSGPGVPEGMRARIFEPFVTSRPRGEGTGLGLPIAKRTAVEHGGTLELATSELGGAAFVLRIPNVRLATAAE